MRASIVFTLLFILVSNYGYAQKITTGDDESTITLGRGSFGYDVSKTAITLEANNFRTLFKKPSGVILGLSASVKNNENEGALFSSSVLNDEASLGFRIGVFGSTRVEISRFYNQRLVTQLNTLEKSMLKDVRVNQQILLGIVERNPSLTTGEKNTISSAITGVFAVGIDIYQKLIDDMDSRNKAGGASEAVKSVTKEIIDFANSYAPFWDAKAIRKILDTQTDEAIQRIKQVPYQKFSFHFFADIKRDEFKTFSTWDSTAPSDSFVDQEFTGTDWGFVGNYRHKETWYAGIRVSFEKTNNSSGLTSTTFQKIDETTIQDQTYRTTTDVTALRGDYQEVNVVNFDADIAHFFPLFDEYFLIGNAYFRHLGSRDEDILPNTSDLGVSFSAFKNGGNLIGGIYLEVPDLNQNLEKRKTEPELESWTNRITVGFYTKVSFSKLTGIIPR